MSAGFSGFIHVMCFAEFLLTEPGGFLMQSPNGSCAGQLSAFNGASLGKVLQDLNE